MAAKVSAQFFRDSAVVKMKPIQASLKVFHQLQRTSCAQIAFNAMKRTYRSYHWVEDLY